MEIKSLKYKWKTRGEIPEMKLKLECRKENRDAPGNTLRNSELKNNKSSITKLK